MTREMKETPHWFCDSTEVVEEKIIAVEGVEEDGDLRVKVLHVGKELLVLEVFRHDERSGNLAVSARNFNLGARLHTRRETWTAGGSLDPQVCGTTGNPGDRCSRRPQ